MRQFEIHPNSINPVINSSTGCIDNDWRVQNISPDESITVRATTEGCRDDEVISEILFPKAIVRGTGKNTGYTPCWPIDINKSISPNPTGGGIVNIDVANQGESLTLKIIHTDLQTNISQTLMSNTNLSADATMSFQINSNNWTIGQHVIEFVTDEGVISEIVTKF